MTQVDYRERPSASGRTPFGNPRREAVTDDESWAAAVVDKVLRPHFPRGLFRSLQVDLANQPAFKVPAGMPCFFPRLCKLKARSSLSVKVSINVLSIGDTDPVALAINAASAALTCSNIAWGGPVGAVHLGQRGGNTRIAPSTQEAAKAEMLLLLASTEDEIVMAEMQVGPLPLYLNFVSFLQSAYVPAA